MSDLGRPSVKRLEVAPPVAPQQPLATGGYTMWQGPWDAARTDRKKRWRAMLWGLLYPPRSNRVSPTLPGLLLIVVALGIGIAAYNTQNNILFITLSLLLSCLVLSGVLSWINLRGVAWRLHLAGQWRAGQAHAVALELRNGKRVVPTYGLWFDLASGLKTERRYLGVRLDAAQTTRVEWMAVAQRRGRLRVELQSVGSLFPFGFLRKSLTTGLGADVLVWPASCEYQRQGEGTNWLAAQSSSRVNRAGQSGDLLALRRYVPGDSPRLVHWKASARLRRIMVRQFAADGLVGYTLRVTTTAAIWSRPEQFELALSFAATLAEDLFRMERLQAVMIDDEAPQAVRRLREVEIFLDRLAQLQPSEPALRPGSTSASPVYSSGGSDRNSRHGSLLQLEPQGPRGIAAYINGKIAATA
jgi:uncharacterized protein (DUF58 family)